MKLIIQRVKNASVTVNDQIVGSINQGYFVLVGIGQHDTKETIEEMSQKLLNLRAMADKDSKMNLSVIDTHGEILLISQFTLYADASQRRPSFIKAAKPEISQPLFDYFVEKVKESGLKVAIGVFGAYMQIESMADGPVTIILEN